MAKLKIEEVKKEVDELGWTLMTDVYVNLKTQMVFKCPNDHENYFTLGQWRSHPECPICKNNPYAKMNDAATKNEGFRILAFD